jgi:hypothetical protein
MNIAGYAYEYADGLNTALTPTKAGDPVRQAHVAVRTDEQTLFCTWKKMNDPDFHIWYSAGGNCRASP